MGRNFLFIFETHESIIIFTYFDNFEVYGSVPHLVSSQNEEGVGEKELFLFCVCLGLVMNCGCQCQTPGSGSRMLFLWMNNESTSTIGTLWKSIWSTLHCSFFHHPRLHTRHSDHHWVIIRHGTRAGPRRLVRSSQLTSAQNWSFRYQIYIKSEQNTEHA